MRRLLFILPALAFVVLLAVFFAGLGRDPRTLPSVLIGKPLPTFAAAPLRPGDVGLTNRDFGGEPTLLNVFASWCGPCRTEAPVLMELRREGVAIHGLDWKEKDPADGVAWLAEGGDPYIRVGSDVSGRTGIDLGVSGVPETFVIDKRGHVRYRHVGAVTPEVWTGTLKPMMDQLRREP